MKVLLLGDVSGVHKNLQYGLFECGVVDTTLATNGDGFKEINGDIKLPSLKSFSIINKLRYRLKLIEILSNIKGYDVIQLGGPSVMPFPIFPYKRILSILKKNNGKVFLSAYGSDSFYWRNARKRLAYGPFDEAIKYDLNGKEPKQAFDKSFSFNNYIANNVEGIIPVAYEYEIAYKGHPNLRKLIPQPLDTSKLKQPNYNLENYPIKILHGVTRYGLKGTRHIEKAFKRLNETFSNKAEFIIHNKLSLNDYLKMLRQVSIIVDQCYSQSYGMNALFAMAMGKVVLSGSEPEAMKSLKVENCPVVNIKPDSEFIYHTLAELISKENRIKELSDISREYVINNHDAPKIANLYLEEWNK